MVYNDNIDHVKMLQKKRRVLVQAIQKEERTRPFKSFAVGGPQAPLDQFAKLEAVDGDLSDDHSSDSEMQTSKPNYMKKIRHSMSAMYETRVADFRQRKLQFEAERINNVIKQIRTNSIEYKLVRQNTNQDSLDWPLSEATSPPGDKL